MAKVPDEECSKQKQEDSLNNVENHVWNGYGYELQLLYFFNENDKTGC